MDNWDREQKAFIENLEKTRDIFREIRNKDRRAEVIRYAEKDKFEKLAKRIGNMIDKLKKHEFTVAVVGLEKAGKSTLANALLKLVVLPEYTERCTYTTTEIRAGEKNVAKVYFYSKEKFAENFKAMLKAVGYDKNDDFETFSLADFEKYWNSIAQNNPMLYSQHNGTTVSDIKAIVENRDIIGYLTGKEGETLEISDPDEYAALSRYITGIDGYENGHAVRTGEPYAVEKVIIFSANLSDMENIVLYDVPGFDSPTDLHKKQTEEMLKQADAIVLVTNVGDRPNLTGTQLDMLQKGRDEDDVLLSEKVFVFGNKIDMAGNAQRAKDNANALSEETVTKYAIAKSNRIICGSAKAYLETLGLKSKDEERRGSLDIGKTLTDWGISNGIEELKNKMNDYYQNDRFNVLKQRAEKITKDVKDLLEGILAKYEAGANDYADGGEYLLQAKGALSNFSQKASEITRNAKEQISETRPFSSLIENSIEEIFPYETALSSRVVEAQNIGLSDSGNVYPTARIDALVREKMHFLCQKNLISLTANATLTKEEEIFTQLAKEFLHDLGLQEDNSHRLELEASVKTLFESFFIKDSEHCHFNTLIERYASLLIDILIKSPFGTPERLQKLTETMAFKDMQALSVYYCVNESNEENDSDSDGEKTENAAAENEREFFDRELAFFAKILAHKDITPTGALENEKALRNFFEEHANDLASGFDMEKLPFSTWAALLTNMHINVQESDLVPRLEKALIGFAGNMQWIDMPPEAKNNQMINAVLGYCAWVKETALEDKLINISEKLQNIKNQDEMISTLNKDIDILRDITLHAVIYAINLEQAFNSVIGKNIDMIRESLSAKENNQVIDDWLRANMRKIRETEFTDIDRQNEARQGKKEIAVAIRDILGKLSA